MSQTYHLVRRNGVWSYRRRVPTHLISTFGKKVIQLSLETTDLKEAKNRRAVEDLKWSTQFEAAEKGAAATAPADMSTVVAANGQPLSEAEVIRLVQEFVENTDRCAQQRFLHDPSESEHEKREIKADVEMSQQVLRNRDDPRADQIISSTGEKILRSAGLSVGEDGVPYYAAFAKFVRRGLLELDQRKLARLDDDHRHAFFDQQFGPRVPDVTFGELAAQFLQVTEEEARANKTSQKWVDKQRANVALLREIIGDVPVRVVDYDACLNVRSKLARLPANRTKLYKDAPIDDAIAQAGLDGKPLLSPFTQERYLGTLRDILDLAAKKRLIAANPADGLKPLKRDAVAPSAKRVPFKPDQLKQFFAGSFYQQCANHSPPWKGDKSGWRFWLPLLCLFMGMRPNEACQMTTDDVRCTDQGTWYVDVVAGDDDENGNGKSLKTAFSRRRIPVHPELIAIGFLKFVDGQRDAGKGSRLFLDLKPDKYGNHASYALKRFRDSYLPAEITLAPRQSFYSFHHNFRDELRRNNAPPDALQALGGWSQGHLVSDDYGDKANPDYQLQFIKQVTFPGLTLSHLHMLDQ